MAQFIRTPFDMDFDGILQVSQIAYHNERLIEIFYDTDSNRVVVQNNGNYFWLTSPDINRLTINHVLITLGINNEQIVVTYTDNNQPNSVLNSIVEQAPLNQISIYPNNHPIPDNHYAGPLPAIAGQPIPDAANPNADDIGALQDPNNDYIHDYHENVDDDDDANSHITYPTDDE